MEKGFIPDTTLLGALQATWHPDDPENAGGTFFGFKTKNRTKTAELKNPEQEQSPLIAAPNAACCDHLRSNRFPAFPLKVSGTFNPDFRTLFSQQHPLQQELIAYSLQ
ncbi:hypothetical protein [Gimesia maris]|uniref:hypothetical protein n=1 Tax=Gimesia maris TaxID=122 RepID=UPI0012B6B365|nr:hypothetical protein [Gimesia maris]